MKHSLLEQIEKPKNLKGLELAQLEMLCEEIRNFMQQFPHIKEGHIKSSLGVVELTVALHYAYNAPKDILIWDVGHQSFAHKILTGRKDAFSQIRQKLGISGFTNADESIYDPFGAGHSSTSISAAIGFAQSYAQQNIKKGVVAIIGDGALTGGMAFEALNFLGQNQLPVTIVLNDNQSSIDENIGALSRFGNYKQFFNSLNLAYTEVEDGHDIPTLVHSFKQAKQRTNPLVIKVNTQKGRGYKNQHKTKVSKPYTFSDAFGDVANTLLRSHPNLHIISPAMISGAGLKNIAKDFPERVIDVAIAEQHAVTMAAGIAASGSPVICHLYSTFAQRAADQIIHDVALQNLPVIFCLDRAGISGQDGATHHGLWDGALLGHIPHLHYITPKNGQEMANALTFYTENPNPVIIRYPKANTEKIVVTPNFKEFDLNDRKSDTLVISSGYISNTVTEVCTELGLSHLHLLRVKPLPWKEIKPVIRSVKSIAIVEEQPIGGDIAHQQIREHLLRDRLNIPVQGICLPSEFIQHGTRDELIADYGLNKTSLKEKILSILK